MLISCSGAFFHCAGSTIMVLVCVSWYLIRMFRLSWIIIYSSDCGSTPMYGCNMVQLFGFWTLLFFFKPLQWFWAISSYIFHLPSSRNVVFSDQWNRSDRIRVMSGSVTILKIFLDRSCRFVTVGFQLFNASFIQRGKLCLFDEIDRKGY